MILKYKEEMQKNGLSLNDLPEDARTGIDQLNDVLKALNMLEKAGKKPSEKTLRKIKAMDKWVTYEIYDHLNDTDKNNTEMPFEDDEIINEIKKDIIDDSFTVIPAKPDLSIQIELEIKNMYDNGLHSITVEDLKRKSPKCYDLLFNSYDPEEDNGIATSYYSLLENKNDDLFYIKKL